MPFHATTSFSKLTYCPSLTDHEFNRVVKEFCEGFSEPKVHNLAEIIRYNEEHADIALPKRNTTHADS